MREQAGKKGFLWLRTLYLLFAIALYWAGSVNWNVFLYGTVFVMTPWTVVLVAGNAARRQIRPSAYHILLTVMAALYALAALRNGNLSFRGLLLVALGVAMTWTAVLLSGKSQRRGLYRFIMCLLAAATAVLLATVICEFFGRGDLLPWGAKRALTRGPRSSGSGDLLLRNQARTLKGLTVLTYACGAMLVAGIIPSDVDTAYLRREGSLLGLEVVVLELMFLAPALASVFIGRPIEASWLPGKLGIQELGSFGDRILALHHPNTTALCAVVGIFCALYCMQVRARRWLSILLGIACAIFLAALAHCQSRTSSIVLGLGVGAMAFRRIYLNLAGRHRRVLMGLIAGGLALVLVIALVSGIYVADVYVASHLGAAAESGEANLLDSLRDSAASKKATERLETEFRDVPVAIGDGVMVPRTLSTGILNVFSNGRGIIWREGLDYLIHNPADLLFGMGSGDILERLRAYNPDRYNALYLHNGFLEALARGGVFMLICLLATLCLLVRPTARGLVATDKADPPGYIFAVLTGILVFPPLVESLLFTDATMFNLLFFYAAGRVMRGQSPMA